MIPLSQDTNHILKCVYFPLFLSIKRFVSFWNVTVINKIDPQLLVYEGNPANIFVYSLGYVGVRSRRLFQHSL